MNLLRMLKSTRFTAEVEEFSRIRFWYKPWSLKIREVTPDSLTHLPPAAFEFLSGLEGLKVRRTS